ncbi:ribosomal protein S18-alanine N-acetyltransferase [Aestuariibacter halophilus]|uniref:[Ribosomal protein bS18]-alanine N-acetyltransferase n=1 Tax=Fluctibacter halophilus TaxID=226011 RepID=A0ABS8G823_9ALTE|nr:ribosomal protein S18-alanine N-acetyltransferase [Aestuariibacter halophilus]MCC2616690.1 ribosomal protein S18-alanine N-acetyltransferase [Aestuariibacter halophilus]
MTLSIVALPEQDGVAAHHIHQQSHVQPWSQSTFIDTLTEPYFTLAAYHGNVLAGYAIGLQVLDEITLMDIAVDHDRKRQGIGRELLQQFIRESHQRQGSVVWLEVRGSNSPAIQLYQSMGFELMDRRKDYYPTTTGREDALMMRKSLTDVSGV